MFFATMDTGGISHSGHEFYSAGNTEDEARKAIANGYWAMWEDDDRVEGEEDGSWGEINVLEALELHVFGNLGRKITREELPELLDEWYCIRVHEVEPGEWVKE